MDKRTAFDTPEDKKWYAAACRAASDIVDALDDCEWADLRTLAKRHVSTGGAVEQVMHLVKQSPVVELYTRRAGVSVRRRYRPQAGRAQTATRDRSTCVDG